MIELTQWQAVGLCGCWLALVYAVCCIGVKKSVGWPLPPRDWQRLFGLAQFEFGGFVILCAAALGVSINHDPVLDAAGRAVSGLTCIFCGIMGFSIVMRGLINMFNG